MSKKFKDEIKSLRKEKGTSGFKVIVTGKGGAGKTTTTALLSQAFINRGYKVLAVDEDPQMNLPFALGYPPNQVKELVPLSQNADYIEEKTGARPGESWGGFLRLNPPVEDVVDRFGVSLNSNLSCLVMGTIRKPATGCLCPENALLDAVVKHVSLRRDELILMDTQAGVEHFGRALAEGFSQCLVVTDATFNSMSVAIHASDLARDIGIKHIHLVLNRIDGEKTKQRALDLLAHFGKKETDFSSVVILPREEQILDFEPAVINLYSSCPESPFVRAIEEMAESLEKYER
ncbi:AAA family ATPase [Desulfohalobiaceae bacterium Ax17]|uniref:ATP-binding protein n=1 Tax=Desulfovulcanus ferrireducens TaxID=2831190 RepID=UPI00207B9E51|nr:AAA family ATPase [Desulfovulcanus ferrireducens]